MRNQGRWQRNGFVSDGDYRLQFILARDLGMTVEELRHRMSQREFGEWNEFYLWEKRERDRMERERSRR